MKERLTELICEGMADRCGSECKIPNRKYCKQCFAVADYLLANGVYIKSVSDKNIEKALTSDEILLLKVYAINNMNACKTAKALFMHRNSIFYNINRIKAKTGLDAKEFCDLVKLLNCFGGVDNEWKR